mmetsp:Transcript_16726/g.40130  ORF Transcript_16726/g.40130 Transcript_16726/m.40130 type:complete len:236 (+) Transcript_16726:588-1295(+)
MGGHHLGRHVGLRLLDFDLVWHRCLGSLLALGVVRQHDLDLDAQDALAHQHRAHRSVDVLAGRLPGRQHVPVSELHALGSLSPQFAADDDLAALGAVLHDVAEDAVAGSADGQTAQQLVAERLGLSHCAEGSVVDALGEELHRILREVEALLDHGGQFADSSALLAQHLTSAGGADDDLSPDGRDSDLHPRVSVLGEHTSEELIQLGIEHAVSHKLALLRHLRRRHADTKSTAPP